MNTTILNPYLIAASLIPILCLVVNQLKFPRFNLNTKIWNIMFHLAFLAKLWIDYIILKNFQIAQGLEFLMVSLVFTNIVFILLVNANSKQIKTIWKIPLIGSLLGLYLAKLLGAMVFVAMITAILFVVFKFRKDFYLLVKPVLIFSFLVIAYQITSLLNGSIFLTQLLGLISYLSALKIMNLAQTKEWIKSIEAN